MAERVVHLSEAELQALVRNTVHETLIKLGVDTSEPLEMQRDFQHLREWREMTNSVRKKGVLTLVGFLVAAGVAAAWMGIKVLLADN